MSTATPSSEERAALNGIRTALGLGGVISLIVGILIPTPLRYFFQDLPTFDRESATSAPMEIPAPMGIQMTSVHK